MEWFLTRIIAFQEIKKVVVEVGENNIVHIVTDNGSNYKKFIGTSQMSIGTLHGSPVYLIPLILCSGLLLISQIMNLSLIVQSSLQDGCIIMGGFIRW
jgi:hypothetical protein